MKLNIVKFLQVIMPKYNTMLVGIKIQILTITVDISKSLTSMFLE